MSPYFEEMKQIAQAYCRLIEDVQEVDGQWLQDLMALLPRLHAAVDALGRSVTINGQSQVTHDLDRRFEMYAKLYRLLGENDGYWMEFDVAHDSQVMSGSLADDLTDIYCELNQGLEQLEEIEPNQIIDDWVTGYKVHWGQHLVDASRHLYTLGARNKI